MELLVFWSRVGKEHAGLNICSDIRKNPRELVEQYLLLKEENARKEGHRFRKHDENIIVELPPEDSSHQFIIIYDKANGLQYSLGYKKKHPWWLIDVVDIHEMKPNVYCSYDMFLDISVHPDGKYNVYDMDEFSYAVQLGILDKKQIVKSLDSFHKAIEMLNRGLFPDRKIKDVFVDVFGREEWEWRLNID